MHNFIFIFFKSLWLPSETILKGSFWQVMFVCCQTVCTGVYMWRRPSFIFRCSSELHIKEISNCRSLDFHSYQFCTRLKKEALLWNGKMDTIILLSGRKRGQRLNSYKGDKEGLAQWPNDVWLCHSPNSQGVPIPTSELMSWAPCHAPSDTWLMTRKTGGPYHAISPQGLLQK